MTENPVNIKFTKQGGLLIAPKTVGDAAASDGIKIPATSTASGAGFGEAISDEDRRFASEREPIGILLTYGMAQDITEKWFMINDPDTEEADPALDRMVQDALSTLKYKTKLTMAVAERRIYGWSLLAGAFTDATKPADLKKPLHTGSELKQLNVYNKTNVRVVTKDIDEMSPRFGQPIIYELNRGNGILTEIHFSRVCTLPDDTAKARSVLDGVWDDMTCGRNIRWGVSQYIYRIGSAFPVVGFPAGTTIEQLQAYDASNAFRDLMSRTHILTAQNSTQENTGMTFEFKGAAGATLDPTNFFKTNDEQISKASGIPQPSLVGAQAGAVTGSEVNMQSKYKVVSRDQQELEDVNRWVIDRLAESGQISLVASSTATDEKAKTHYAKLKATFNRVFGSDYRHKTAKTYLIEWNSAFELSEKDEASIEQMHTASNVNKLKYMSKDEVRAEDGLDPLPDGAGEWKEVPEGLQLFNQDPNKTESEEKDPDKLKQQLSKSDMYVTFAPKVPAVKPKDAKNVAADAEGEGSWVTINGVHILIKEGESAAQAFERTTGKKLEGSSENLNTGGAVSSGEGKQNMQTFTHKFKGDKTVTYSAEIGELDKLNIDNDKLMKVTNLKINNSDDTLNTDDIINVASDPDDWSGGQEDQYKIQKINQLLFQGNAEKNPYASGLKRDKQVSISGASARGSTAVFYPDKFWRITKQKFSK